MHGPGPGRRLVVITAGVPVGGMGLTNMLKVHRVGEEKGWR